MGCQWQPRAAPDRAAARPGAKRLRESSVFRILPHRLRRSPLPEGAFISAEQRQNPPAANQEDAAPVTIEQMSGYVTLYDTKQSVYLSLNSRSNALNVATDATTDNARRTLSFSSGAVLLKNKAYSDYAIYYNSNANIFRCYSSAQKYISLYKATATTPTAIRTVTGDNGTAAADTSWYTLSGQRLTSRPVQAGGYIHAGRKVVVK